MSLKRERERPSSRFPTVPNNLSEGELQHSAVKNSSQHDADFKERMVPERKPKVSLKSLRIF